MPNRATATLPGSLIDVLSARLNQVKNRTEGVVTGLVRMGIDADCRIDGGGNTPSTQAIAITVTYRYTTSRSAADREITLLFPAGVTAHRGLDGEWVAPLPPEFWSYVTGALMTADPDVVTQIDTPEQWIADFRDAAEDETAYLHPTVVRYAITAGLTPAQYLDWFGKPRAWGPQTTKAEIERAGAFVANGWTVRDERALRIVISGTPTAAWARIAGVPCEHVILAARAGLGTREIQRMVSAGTFDAEAVRSLAALAA